METIPLVIIIIFLVAMVAIATLFSDERIAMMVIMTLCAGIVIICITKTPHEAISKKRIIPDVIVTTINGVSDTTFIYRERND